MSIVCVSTHAHVHSAHASFREAGRMLIRYRNPLRMTKKSLWPIDERNFNSPKGKRAAHTKTGIRESQRAANKRRRTFCFLF